MKFNAQKIFSDIIDNVLDHPKLYVLIATFLTLLAILTITLKFDIRSDLKELMPQDAQVVEDMHDIADRMGSIQTLSIYIKAPELKPLSDEAKSSPEYLACLQSLGEGEHLLRSKPPVGDNWCDNALMLFSRRFIDIIRAQESVGNVAFHNDKTFFENNLLLYASNEDLLKAYDKIDEALTEARRQSGEYKACLITADDETECDELKPGLQKQGQEAASDTNAVSSLKDQLLDRYNQTELANIREFPFYTIENNGWMVALTVRFKKATTGLKAVQKEVNHLDELLKDIDMNQYDPAIEIEYGGGLSTMKSEYNAIITDITRSISITIFSILALIAVFFRSGRAAARIFIPLVMTTLWALGVTFLTFGYLNLITAFIFAILIGLGIDFGIHLYARFILERQNGLDTKDALKTAVVETGSPLFFGALTTAAAFYTLTFGSFPGFSQFGFVAGTGVLLALIGMTTVMPAFTLLSEKIKPSKINTQNKRPPLVGKKAAKFTIPVFAFCICGLAFAAYSASRIPDIQFEGNFYKLKLKATKEQKQNPKADTEKFVESTRPNSPTVALLNNTDQVETLELILKRDREYNGHQRIRRFYTHAGPNFAYFLTETFPEVLPYAGQYRALPIYTALSKTLPRIRNMNEVLPLYANYGSEKSLALQKYRTLAMTMPNTIGYLCNTFPEALHQNTVANALPIVSNMTAYLPRWLWDSIPTQRNSKQFNTISDFASIFSYLPGTKKQQEERLQTIAKIRERTADRQIRFLPEKEKQQIIDFRRYLVDTPIHVDDLPEWVKLQFKEGGDHPLPPRPDSGVDYAFGNIALLYQSTSTYQEYQADMLTHDARSIRVDGQRITAATGAFVYADMMKLVKTDGMQIAMLALIVILLIAIIQQKNPIAAIIVTLPVISGIAITLSIMIWLDCKLGLFNIVMLPVTLGIGIDGSIYLLQRYQMLGKGSTLEAVRAVIGPVFMSSSTTLVGFGGMVASQHMGLNSMGMLAIIGISSCFFATFIIQPGLILLADKCNLKGAVADHDFKTPDETPTQA